MAKDLAEEIMSMIPPSGRARPWWEKIDKKHLPTLKTIADGWLAGKYGPSVHRASRAIAAWLNSEGIASVKLQGVRNWLDQLTP
jgi:hypothetical protein